MGDARRTFDYDEASRWAKEICGEPNFLQFWFPKSQFLSAECGEGWISATRRDRDSSYGMAIGKNAKLNPEWGHFSISRFADQSLVDTSKYVNDAQWDAYVIKTDAFASYEPLENMNSPKYFDEINGFLEENFPDASVKAGNPEVVAWPVLRDEDGEILAIGALSKWESGGLAAQSITVSSNQRGKGIGRRFMEGFISSAFHLGYKELCLGVMYENEPAKRLYESLGFVNVDRFYHYSTIDDHERRRNRPMPTDKKPTVLFVCVHNAGRSQIAAGYMRHLSGGQIEVLSAGSAPKDSINPVAVEVMREEGIDIAGNQPKVLSTEAVIASDVVITMGCGDACPFFPGKRYEDWVLEDPAGKDIDVVRKIRDEIKERVQTLIKELLP